MPRLKSINYSLNIYLSLTLCSATACATLILSSSISFADDSIVSDVAVTVPVSCNLSSTLDTAHTATINPGQSQSDIGTTTFKIICNDNSGYAIYAIGYSNEEYGNTKLLATIGGQLSPTHDINTGTETSGNTSAWAMKLMPVTGTYAPTIENGYDNYSVIPTTYTKVATFTSSTDAVIGSSVQSTYRAYIDSNKPAGIYAGKVRYSLVHPNDAATPLQPQPSTAGCINYFANASDAIGTMGCQSATDDEGIDLLASNFSRTNYGFAGWSDAFDYATNANANFYGPNETITVPTGTTANGLSLYAVWVKSAGNLQGWTGCSSLTKADTATNILTESITALTDQRDSQTYAIAKLADGKCWMIENLRLESTNSDNSTGTLAQGYGTSTTYGNFSGLAMAESPWNNGITTANSLYYSGTQDGTATINIGSGSNPGFRFPRYNHDNTYSRDSSPTTNDVAVYSYGNYYTWHAAIANTTAYTTNNQSVANTSICPTGWRLPTGGGAYARGNTGGINVTGNTSTYREFYNLGYSIMGTTAYESVAQQNAYYNNTTTNIAGDTATKAFRKYPNNFVYSGNIYNGSVGSRGSNGYYWSSTTYSSNGAYSLLLGSSNVYPGTTGDSKNSGRTVRCVASGS